MGIQEGGWLAVYNVGAGSDILGEYTEQFLGLSWPEQLLPVKHVIGSSARCTCKAFAELAAAKDGRDGILIAYRALGQYTKAVEALYPLAKTFPPINRFYTEISRRGDSLLLEKLAATGLSIEGLGVTHEKNERHERGGYSVYVPEYYQPDQAMPLIMALHGGGGHGRNFLWSWLTTARTHGAVLVCPSSVASTWSLTGPDRDSENLARILKIVSNRWNIDGDRLLLTGMSDGGTYTYLNGLQAESPFTHLAPVSASFHPMLLDFFDNLRMSSLPVYLTHGVLDWMFSIDVANVANDALTARGVDVVYRPIADLSHTYPVEENTRIVDWLLR